MILLLLSILGIGGGFAGLALSYRRGNKERRQFAHLCSVGAREVAEAVFAYGPSRASCQRCAVEDYNRSLRERQSEMRRMIESVQEQIKALT